MGTEAGARLAAGIGAGNAAAAAAGGSTGLVLAAPAGEPSDSGRTGVLSGLSTVAAAGVGISEATDLGFADALGRGAAFTSRQAPRLRTYSRTSAATEVHGKGCAAAAVAPSNSAALTSNVILRRFMALHRMRAGKGCCSLRPHSSRPLPKIPSRAAPRAGRAATTAASTAREACRGAQRWLRSAADRVLRRRLTVRTTAARAARRRPCRRALCA